ncbi:MAG: DUF4189 domain-containing protein [Magnetococcales bacterium]|nr:DUF4189 domain-containing protein [Magnetococcales bacterium]
MQKIMILLVLLASFYVAPNAWAVGAIAIDDQMGDDEPAYGVAVGEDDKRSAKRAALKYCRQEGGSNCRFIVWFETCGAVAVSEDYYGYGYGRTKAKATADALKMCGSNECNIVSAECE